MSEMNAGGWPNNYVVNGEVWLASQERCHEQR